MPVVSTQDVNSVVVATTVKESGTAVLVTTSSGGADWLAELAIVLNGLAIVNPRFSVVLGGANDELVLSDTVCTIDSVRTFARTDEDIEVNCFRLSSEEA